MAPVVWAIVSLPIVLPVLPMSAVGRMRFLHKLNHDFGETAGWPQLTAAVGRVYRSLPPASRGRASIFAANCGEASALLIYGGRYDLPPAISGRNNFWLWGPGNQPDQTVIAVGSASQLRPYFSSCRLVATFHSPHNVNNDENGVALSVCAPPKGPWRLFWSRLRQYD